MTYVLHHLAVLVASTALAWSLAVGTWQYRAPRLSVSLWQLAGASIAVSGLGALLSVGLSSYGLGVLPGTWSLVGDLASGRRPALSAAQTLTLGAAAVLMWGLVGATLWCALRQQIRRRRLRHLLDVVGDDAGEGQVCLDHPALVAYCIPGRRGRIVVSSGTRRALSTDELSAVVAHERAHLRWRHDLALLPFTAVSVLLPWSRGAGRVLSEVALLVEMCADDEAVRTQRHRALASALHRFEAGSVSTPPGVLSVAGAQLTARIARLSRQSRPLPWLVRVALMAGAVTLLATPLSLYVAPA
jgi:Zn-dependent protease with chaperone function